MMRRAWAWIKSRWLGILAALGAAAAGLYLLAQTRARPAEAAALDRRKKLGKEREQADRQAAQEIQDAAEDATKQMAEAAQDLDHRIDKITRESQAESDAANAEISEKYDAVRDSPSAARQLLDDLIAGSKKRP